MKKITLLILLLTFSFGYGQEIASYSSVANVGCSGIISADSNLNLASTSGICRGPGINVNAGTTYNSRDWTTAATLDTDDYLEWTLTPNAGYEIDLATMDITYDRSGQGPTMVDIQIDIGSGFSSIFTDASVSAVSEDNNGIDLTAYTNITGTITFRLYAFSATSASGTFDIEENTATDKGIVINGTVNALATCSSPTVTWTAGAWSPLSGPTINTPVIISDNYDTGNGGSEVSFRACSLTIDSGARLTVENGDFVEVENDVTVDGQLYVDPQGSFVQNNDTAAFNDNSTNGVRVRKSKTMQNWYSYTYWSSPVSGTTIESTFGITPTDRRFRFEAANFVDLLTEIGNSNTFVFGPDDIDDDGNDWVSFSSGTMIPGVGYATTGAEFVGPGGYPNPESYDFFGPLNNGTITVSLVDNSGGAYNDWNLIGNPYACAIDVDQFFTVNSGLVDVVYFWDQATPPNSNAGGSQNNNFSVDDYAIINAGTGEIGARGDTGTRPTRHIPSGQGFFVEALAAGNVIFNNSMRITGNNTQFFKGSKGKNSNPVLDPNKLWINLSSDNGISNQILIGYVNGASKNDDGTYYDTPRNLSSNVAAILYSVVENCDKKFAIQGKAPSDLNENEIIDLGFKTAIDVATLYTFSIAQFQGAFLNNNPVFLIDNLLNKTHDLKVCDYSFTSEVGEFNNRFQIAFSDKALSTNAMGLNDNALKIIELANDHVNFKLSDNLKIKSVTIFDLLGRQLYNLKGANSSETYQLSKLKNTVYIAKVELSNGAVITKKAIKQ
ncbi:T9SS sorting signal type C domain-containing protein [Hwangdonia seohaensis]|uniref:T9SS sorting signal type C domain-containing protein n=1 Tax=Hwangdonia seohaensis TaxID=1240727 RepID=A0ABW3R8T7_9FLAO|nr:T9SS sorting signal type C domain-containing protein [Hwangdonia seohaensis]